jgi:hypothetical protein
LVRCLREPAREAGAGNGFFLNFQFLRLPPIGGAQLAQLGRRGRVQFRPAGSRHRGKRFLLPLINAFGVDIQGARRGLRRAAFTGQAQGLGPEGGIIAPTFGRWGLSFMTFER